MHKIVLIQNIVKQNQKYILKIIKKVCKNKHEKVTRNFLKKKKTKQKNAEECHTEIRLMKISKNKKNMEKAIVTLEKRHFR